MTAERNVGSQAPVHLGTPEPGALLSTWSSRSAGFAAATEEDDAFAAAVLDRLAEGQPADTDYLADATGLAAGEVTARIEAAAAAGYEVVQGAIIGAALTLRPTDHRFRVRGNDLFTWCGFDALFLPRLLDERAEVTSTCPVTGEPIELTVEGDGTVTDADPATTVAAIVGPDVVACSDTTGPDSDVCTQMPFLSSPEAGAVWLEDHPGVAVVDLTTATAVAARYTATTV